METVAKPESAEFYKKYDGIVVLGGGLRRDGDHYAPASYDDSDDFGMLGGDMRVAAAAALYREGATSSVVFTTGVYEKNVTKFGPQVPPESHVYADTFRQELASSGLPENVQPSPNIILEDKSTTTLTNVQEVLKIILENGWSQVCILSNAYHIPRIQALYTMALEKIDDKAAVPTVTFLSAEDVVKTLEPGKYDELIEHSYATPEAVKRTQNESNGLRDIMTGKYALKEFQLVKPKTD